MDQVGGPWIPQDGPPTIVTNGVITLIHGLINGVSGLIILLPFWVMAQKPVLSRVI